MAIFGVGTQLLPRQLGCHPEALMRRVGHLGHLGDARAPASRRIVSVASTYGAPGARVFATLTPFPPPSTPRTEVFAQLFCRWVN